jgi:hypothetical protein
MLLDFGEVESKGVKGKCQERLFSGAFLFLGFVSGRFRFSGLGITAAAGCGFFFGFVRWFVGIVRGFVGMCGPSK